MTGLEEVEDDITTECGSRSSYGQLIERARTIAHAVAAGAPFIDFEEYQ
ncbi:hypothetical protein [Prescottella equi]|nr:hypothetical protein [Prescottella equi]